MANLTVRRTPPSQPTTREFDPLRMMRDWMRFDPFQEIAPFIQADPRLNLYQPAFEVKETKDAYVFKADVPGVKEQDIDVTMTGNRLTVSGKRESETTEQTDTYYTAECSYGTFSRAFTLPEGTDANHVHADLKGGVLTVAVPKLPEVQAKKIQVKAIKQ